MILVTGATGNVGRHVVRELLTAGERVRAMSRDPGRAGGLLPDGAEIVAGDLRSEDTLSAGLDGVDRAFLFPVRGHLDAFLRIGRRDALRRVVLLSSLAVTRDNMIGRNHGENEEAVRRSGVAWTMLRPGAFMANDLQWAPQIRARGAVRSPYGQAASAPIDERDIAAVAVRALLDDGHASRCHALTGPESLTPVERVRILSEVLGRPLRFEEQPVEEARRSMGAMPPGLADALLGMAAAMVGRVADVTDTVGRVTGRPPYTYRAWAEEHAGAF